MSEASSNSWYLDPLVARQKAEVNHGLVVRWVKPASGGAVLKTDLFAEANGADHILDKLSALGVQVVGMDCDRPTVASAHHNHGSSGVLMTVNDLLAQLSRRDVRFNRLYFDPRPFQRPHRFLALVRRARSYHQAGRQVDPRPRQPLESDLLAITSALSSRRLVFVGLHSPPQSISQRSRKSRPEDVGNGLRHPQPANAFDSRVSGLPKDPRKGGRSADSFLDQILRVDRQTPNEAVNSLLFGHVRGKTLGGCQPPRRLLSTETDVAG